MASGAAEMASGAAEMAPGAVERAPDAVEKAPGPDAAREAPEADAASASSPTAEDELDIAAALAQVRDAVAPGALLAAHRMVTHRARLYAAVAEALDLPWPGEAPLRPRSLRLATVVDWKPRQAWAMLRVVQTVSGEKRAAEEGGGSSGVEEARETQSSLSSQETQSALSSQETQSALSSQETQPALSSQEAQPSAAQPLSTAARRIWAHAAALHPDRFFRRKKEGEAAAAEGTRNKEQRGAAERAGTF
ncbi:hypothetical protein H632_c702p1 [Helicosporidium sp. ATCC 50920]|nr:hypothetical protein H632_c702p1 [Helicosporidium sp. ATCC 50920]|eukprot:KDD75401.1 hypothetical protein H632_c702p1 [Helicosporidium sp. ATCC 50920]